MARVQDMTKGNPLKLIIAFALPLLMGGICQQLYNMVDTIVVGKGVGVDALSAVGSVGWLLWLYPCSMHGLASGFSIFMSQRFGAQDHIGLKKAIAHSLVLSGIVTVVLTALALLTLNPMLHLMGTPKEAFAMAYEYAFIFCCGMPLALCYNVFGGILRALGDSRTPLLSIVAASLTNIALDYLFIFPMDMGVAGAAYATIISQGICGLICIMGVLRLPLIRLQKSDFRFDKKLTRDMVKLGVPVSLQNMVICVGGLALQAVINGFGYVFVAAITAGNKLCMLMEMVGVYLGEAMATFAGQNLGAGKYHRIREGVRNALIIVLFFAVIMALLSIFCGRDMLLLFIDKDAPEVAEMLDSAYPYLLSIGCMMWSLYLLHLHRCTLQGMGDTVIPMYSGFVELAMRVGFAFGFTGLWGEYGIYVSEVSAWFSAAVLLVTTYMIRIRKLIPKERNEAPPEITA